MDKRLYYSCVTVCVPMGEELPSWRGTCPLRSRGPKGGMWLWEVHFRIQKHTLPVCLNASLSIYCMYSTFQTARQTARQTGHIWGATNGRLPSFSIFSPGSLPLSSHPERGSGEVGVVGQTGQLCDHSVCIWEGGRDPQALLQTQLHTGPHKQLLHSQRQPSRATLQDLYCHKHKNICLCFTINHKQEYLVSHAF